MLRDILKSLKGKSYQEGLLELKAIFGDLVETGYQEKSLYDIYVKPFNNDMINGIDSWICYTTKVLYSTEVVEVDTQNGYWSILDECGHLLEGNI